MDDAFELGGSPAVLRELSVQNLALIEDVHVELQAGYCAWTGETGAGKSLLLTALGLVLGGKASADLVRAGRSEARAAAVFEVKEPSLRAEIEAILGGPLDDDQLILTRRVLAQGRGSAQANGLPVTVAILQALGERLIDIHGQHEGRALLDPDRQRALLDAHGGLGPQLEDYRRCREAHDQLRRKRFDLIQASHDRQRQRALLEFERDELASLDPRPGEFDELARDAHRLGNVEHLREAAAEGYALLYEADRSAQELLERVARRLEPLASSVAEIADAAANLERLADETREVAYALRNLSRSWDDDPARLEGIETRLAHYRRLASRFHCEADDLAVRRAAIEEQLAVIEQDDADLLSFDLPLAQAWRELTQAAMVLSMARQKTCKAFGKAIQGRLKTLGLTNAKLSVEVVTQPLGDDPTVTAPGEAGIDRVELVFAANPGEEARPLRKIASGGELSRVTLAVKTVLAGADRVPTLVFDEIDTGVGGRLGAILGKNLAELAEHHQIICVTHLPQMASFARLQWVIRKQVERGRTRTTITPLDDSDRVNELAAMLRGDSAAEGTRQEALSMLLEAQTAR
ncbi:DNA repair protein RecN [Singulisphaera acidiphila]|uniref:DNA repair protein RecN n=1 Tax=Singulisphaera acidiphila TaxID=466153 RepID=UPI000305A854|nr:DNA repair protein RecN [Singulisphaera acidiphila]